VTVAELRRRFCLESDGVCRVERPGTAAFIGLPEREAAKLQELWQRDEVGLELSVEVHAPVVVGVYPMRIARFVQDQLPNGHAPAPAPAPSRLSLGEPIPMPSSGTSPIYANGAATNGHAAPFDRRGNGNLNGFADRRSEPARGS
jgi:hypothetical protein